MTECVVAIDQGTQSTRCIIYDVSDFSVVASERCPVRQYTPVEGWVEQDPKDIWQGVVSTLVDALRAAERSLGSEFYVKCMGIANQRETTVVWDALTGAPLHNAVVWHDGRTIGLCEEIIKGRGKDCYREITGLPVSPYFSAYKLKWLVENVDAVASAVSSKRCMFGTIDSWLIYNLTGRKVHCTDVTNASRTGLMNISSLEWDTSMINEFGLDGVILPKIYSNAEEFGPVSSTALLGDCGTSDASMKLLNGVFITGCIGDQQAAMLGHSCAPGEAKNTYGTGCFLLLNTGNDVVHSTHGLVSTVAHKLGPNAEASYALEGSISTAGQGISWMKDNLELFDDSRDTSTLASQVPNCGGVLFVPALSGLLAPWWCAEARGTIYGLSNATNKCHIVRAMLAAICFQSRDVLEAMMKDSGLRVSKMVVDGGASENDVLMQMQSDVLNIPIERPSNHETTSVGAAVAACIGVGIPHTRLPGIREVHSAGNNENKSGNSPKIFTPFGGKETQDMDTHSGYQRKDICYKPGIKGVEMQYLEWKRAVAMTMEVSRNLQHRTIIDGL